MSSWRFIGVVALVLGVLTAAGLALTVIIDPYGVDGLVAVKGVNAKKPESYTQVWAAKEARFRRAHPKTLLLGNSRTDVGLDPQSTAWPAEARPVYNFAIPGIGPDKVRETYAYAVETGAPKQLYIGLDFMDFLSNDPASAVVSGMPKVPTSLSWTTLSQVYLSQTALIDSVMTMLKQGDPYARTMTPEGWNTLADYKGIIRTEGHYSVALQRNEENIKAYLHRPRQILMPGGGETDSVRALRSMIEDAAARGIRMTFFTYPYHADLMETIGETGFWPLMEDWKRLMTRILAEYRQRYPGLIGPLWDFTQYNDYTTEPIPPAGNHHSKMKWYWEPGHFKVALGDILIHRMVSGQPTGFGTVLTPETVDHVLADEDAARARYRKARPGSVRRIGALCQKLGC